MIFVNTLKVTIHNPGFTLRDASCPSRSRVDLISAAPCLGAWAVLLLLFKRNLVSPPFLRDGHRAGTLLVARVRSFTLGPWSVNILESFPWGRLPPSDCGAGGVRGGTVCKEPGGSVGDGGRAREGCLGDGGVDLSLMERTPDPEAGLSPATGDGAPASRSSMCAGSHATGHGALSAALMGTETSRAFTQTLGARAPEGEGSCGHRGVLLHCRPFKDPDRSRSPVHELTAA